MGTESFFLIYETMERDHHIGRKALTIHQGLPNHQARHHFYSAAVLRTLQQLVVL